MSAPNKLERRRFQRVETLGTAFVYFDDYSGRSYRIENLSAGGAQLSGGPHLPLGERLKLVLRLHGVPAAQIEAKVIWQKPEPEAAYGVEFLGLDPMMQDLIEDAVIAALREESPVICDANSDVA